MVKKKSNMNLIYIIYVKLGLDNIILVCWEKHKIEYEFILVN